MRIARHGPTLLLLAAPLIAAACKDSPFSPPYDPVLPAQWANAVTNPFFPLTPGARWEYSGETEDGTEMIVVEVLAAPRSVNGVSATVVRDRVYLDGELVEDTDDWYAQDDAGNVWYLGEDSKEIRNGVIVGTAGSWEWGVDGALPGVIMWAAPSAHMGESYRQEYYRGEAEDWAKVVGSSETVQVPFGSFTDCIRTEEWNALEGRSESLEYKYYCAGTGLVLEVPAGEPTERIELISKTG